MDVKNELNFGFTLKRIRKEKKLSQEELAFKSNISERTIRNIENSKTSISYNTLVSLSNALEVDLFKYYIDKNLKFYKLHNKIFYAVLKKIIGSNFDLNIEIKEIEYLKSIISNEYESKIYLRLKFFVEAIKSLFNDDVFKSKALLEKSICTTKSEFNDNYNLNYFNEFEIFIFLFLILVKQKLRIKMDFEKLDNSTQFIKPNSLEYIFKEIILSNCYENAQNYLKSLRHIDKALNCSISTRNLSFIEEIYFQKYKLLKLLDAKDSLNYLNLSKFYAKQLENEDFYEKIKNQK